MYRFENENRRIVFDDYRTPTPWMNYLSNGTFHVMISQAGGGVAFYKSPQIWRINHYRFFHLPMDRSGFYTYIRDGEEVWCPTCEPCPVKPERWSGFHGMGRTGFEAERKGLRVSALYLVGAEENAMIWDMSFCSDRDRRVQVFPYVELGMMEFLREIQWQCYNKHQLACYALGDILVYRYGVEDQPRPSETPLVFFACDTDVTSFDCDRDVFVGSYRSEENPLGVERGHLSGSSLRGGDPCFALQLDLDLKAGEERKVRIFLGTGMTEEEIRERVSRCRGAGFAERAAAGLEARWEAFLSGFQCRLPDGDAETMINIWNPYQVERNFQFSRNISYYATGTFRGVGMRDTAQDILAMIPLDVGRAKEKLRLLFTQQYRDGHCNHYFFPKEGWEPVTRVHSDNHLWLVMDVYHVVMEEGRLDYLFETAPYYDGGEGSVWEHIRRSVEFTACHMGENGFPLMLHSDWNDMLYKVCRKGKGESIWTGMQFGAVLGMMEELAALLGEERGEYIRLREAQRQAVNGLGWDGEWFRRCITDEGVIIGSAREPQAKIWLNTQTWSVISGLGDREKQLAAMDSVKRYLDTELGIRKIWPAMEDYPSKEDPLTYYNKGCGENGSVFCHANTWAVIAECMLGRSENAWKYYRQLLPMAAQRRAGEERYRAEPYVYSSNIFGPESDRFGLANVSWLTGTAAWMYLAATQYLLGIRASFEGLTVKPCLPEELLPAVVTRRFRGRMYRITIRSNEDVEVVPIEDSAG
ncbi:MAG: hypothetical protein HFH91_12385 [Lachnospiraceae bacterium]|nr:hypothetical protein [Lachnospiraceae bacterium]